MRNAKRDEVVLKGIKTKREVYLVCKCNRCEHYVAGYIEEEQKIRENRVVLESLTDTLCCHIHAFI